MSTKNVQVSLAPELAELLKRTGTDLESRVNEALILRLFEEGIISSGKAASLLGISKDAFRTLLRERGIAYFRQSIADVGDDASVATNRSD